MTGERHLRILVADDHPLYREGMVRMVRERPGFELAGETEDGRRALAAVLELEPDIALLDLHLPELDALAVLRAVRREGRATRVVIISGDLRPELVYQAIAAGASAFLPKEATRARIGDALAAAGRGDTILPPEIQAGLAEQIRLHEPAGAAVLSKREQEILTLTAEGLSAPAIAERLHLSAATVRSHLQHLYEKLGVSDRAAAVAHAMRRGLVE